MEGEGVRVEKFLPSSPPPPEVGVKRRRGVEVGVAVVPPPTPPLLAMGPKDAVGVAVPPCCAAAGPLPSSSPACGAPGVVVTLRVRVVSGLVGEAVALRGGEGEVLGEVVTLGHRLPTAVLLALEERLGEAVALPESERVPLGRGEGVLSAAVAEAEGVEEAGAVSVPLGAAPALPVGTREGAPGGEGEGEVLAVAAAAAPPPPLGVAPEGGLADRQRVAVGDAVREADSVEDRVAVEQVVPLPPPRPAPPPRPLGVGEALGQPLAEVRFPMDGEAEGEAEAVAHSVGGVEALRAEVGEALTEGVAVGLLGALRDRLGEAVAVKVAPPAAPPREAVLRAVREAVEQAVKLGLREEEGEPLGVRVGTTEAVLHWEGVAVAAGEALVERDWEELPVWLMLLLEEKEPLGVRDTAGVGVGCTRVRVMAGEVEAEGQREAEGVVEGQRVTLGDLVRRGEREGEEEGETMVAVGEAGEGVVDSLRESLGEMVGVGVRGGVLVGEGVLDMEVVPGAVGMAEAQGVWEPEAQFEALGQLDMEEQGEAEVEALRESPLW
jgi:hypothetical protein